MLKDYSITIRSYYAFTTKLLATHVATKVALEMRHQTKYLFGFKTPWDVAFFIALLLCCCLADPLDAELRFNAFREKIENRHFLRSGGGNRRDKPPAAVSDQTSKQKHHSHVDIAGTLRCVRVCVGESCGELVTTSSHNLGN